MAMTDLSGILSIAPTVLRDLPNMLFTMQIVYYVVLVLIFGSIVMKGYRGYLHFALRILFKLGFGFVALVCGLAMSEIIPAFSDNPFYSMVQLILINPILGLVISSVVLAFSVYLISHNIFNIPGMKGQIEKLQKKLKRAEETTSKTGGKKLDPVRIAGIVVLIAFLAFCMINFHGFPSVGDRLFSSLGISPEDVDRISRQMGIIGGMSEDVPEGCVATATLLQENYDAIVSDTLPEHSDDGLRSVIESNSGYPVLKMYKVTHNSEDFILAITENSICSSTATKFCSCLDI
jgi:hypothetical protein